MSTHFHQGFIVDHCFIVSLAKAYATQIISLDNPLAGGMVFPPTHYHTQQETRFMPPS